MGSANSTSNILIGSYVMGAIGVALAVPTGGISLTLTAAAVVNTSVEIVGSVSGASDATMGRARVISRALTTIATGPIAGPIIFLVGIGGTVVCASVDSLEHSTNASETRVVFDDHTDDRPTIIKTIQLHSNDLHQFGMVGTILISAIGAVVCGTGMPQHYFLIIETAGGQFYTIQKNNYERSIIYSETLRGARQLGFLKGTAPSLIGSRRIKGVDVSHLNRDLYDLLELVECEHTEYHLRTKNCQHFANNIYQYITD